MNKQLSLIGLFVLLSHFVFSQCPTNNNTCQDSSPCVSIDLAQTTIEEVNGECQVTVVVNLDQGSSGGTIKRVKIGVSALAGGGTQLCEEITAITSTTTIVSSSFTFNDICFNFEPLDIEVEGFTCLPNDNCCCGRSVATSFDVLPVEMSSFEGHEQKNGNLLTWSTESEENTLLFSVEKSADGRNDFESIGSVGAVGFSESRQNYFFTDSRPWKKTYYRLKILDNDASFQYSDLMVVERSQTKFAFLEVFPVPASDHATAIIQSTGDVQGEFILYNMQGQKLIHKKQKLIEGINKIDLTWEQDQSVMYFLTAYNGEEWVTKKIVLARK